jgi:Bifunctional DNA primase/polymerase, N-terminal
VGAVSRPPSQEAAHRYAEHGWPVFPCIPGEKIPATAHGYQDATTDHGQIHRWWSRNPDRNVAIATGAPGPDVLDIDRHGEASGFASLRRLEEAGLTGQPRATVRTPSGGAHLYYAGTEYQGNGHIDAAHVDFRSRGGYVVAAPSRVAGRPYEVVSHQASADTFDWAKARELLDPHPEGKRREWQPRPGGSRQDLSHLARLVASTGEGGRNAALFWAACRAAEAGRTDVFPELAAAAQSAGLPQREVARTLASAEHTAGVREPARPFEREAG